MPKPGNRAANRLVMRFVTARLKAATHLLRNLIRRVGASTSTRSERTHAVIGMFNYLQSLHNRGGCPLGWLLCRSQCDEHNSDDCEHNHSREFSALDHIPVFLRENNMVSGTTPAVNNNPTTTNTAFNVRSRTMLPSLSSSQSVYGSASSDSCFAYSAFASPEGRTRQACGGSEMANGGPRRLSQTCELCQASPAGHRV